MHICKHINTHITVSQMAQQINHLLCFQKIANPDNVTAICGWDFKAENWPCSLVVRDSITLLPVNQNNTNQLRVSVSSCMCTRAVIAFRRTCSAALWHGISKRHHGWLHVSRRKRMLAFTSPVAEAVIGELASGRNWQNVQIGKSIVKKIHILYKIWKLNKDTDYDKFSLTSFKHICKCVL